MTKFFLCFFFFSRPVGPTLQKEMRAVFWAVCLWMMMMFSSKTRGDFVFEDFNSTEFLQLVGSAHFQTCQPIPGLPYVDESLGADSTLITQFTIPDYPNPRQIINYNFTRSIFEERVRRRDELGRRVTIFDDRFVFLKEKFTHGIEPDDAGQVWLQLEFAQKETEAIKLQYAQAMEDDRQLFLERPIEYRAILPHNNHENYTCDNRIQLNPPAPHRAGALWYREKQRVDRGFNTTFSFQITARNQQCVDKLLAHASNQRGTVITQMSRICTENGADGFAFVIQNLDAKAVGEPGASNGFAGMAKSVAVEFDLFGNQELGDPNGMHVAVHIAHPNGVNEASYTTRVGIYSHLNETGRNIKDGLYHSARVVYSPGLQFNPFEQPEWRASAHLAKFLKSDGLGTLRVYVDDMDLAVINIPISLKYAIQLDSDGLAWVGFTGSTGNQWQNHDILRWEFHNQQ